MRKRITNTIMQVVQHENEEKKNLPFTYAANEDIFNKSINESTKNSDSYPGQKLNNRVELELKQNEKGVFKNDLDVPGSELDDEQEKNGSEDEENNYYSIGGDRHDDLEEDKSE
ncbi:MAG TPA: hypothetical protein PK431_05240 [Chitinophagales bacterium]|nr:hypothetical protein [Chitinophagales bacterium]